MGGKTDSSQEPWSVVEERVASGFLCEEDGGASGCKAAWEFCGASSGSMWSSPSTSHCVLP